jgi:hypothetical protein
MEELYPGYISQFTIPHLHGHTNLVHMILSLSSRIRLNNQVFTKEVRKEYYFSVQILMIVIRYRTINKNLRC